MGSRELETIPPGPEPGAGRSTLDLRQALEQQSNPWADYRRAEPERRGRPGRWPRIIRPFAKAKRRQTLGLARGQRGQRGPFPPNAGTLQGFTPLRNRRKLTRLTRRPRRWDLRCRNGPAMTITGQKPPAEVSPVLPVSPVGSKHDPWTQSAGPVTKLTEIVETRDSPE